MRNHFRVAVVQLALCLASARDARAVAAPAPPSLDCQSAAQQVQAGLPQSGLGQAYSALVRCAVTTAAPALAAAWSRVAADSDDFGWRGAVSMRFADRRILNAALAAGTSSSRSVQERLSALTIVLSLLTHPTHLSETFWYRPQTSFPDVVADIDVFSGEQPITASDRSAVLQALGTMANSDSDPQARLVAQRLVALLH